MSSINLGEVIELSGFDEIDKGEFIVIKKIVGNYFRKFSNKMKVEKLKINLKSIHKSEKSEIFSLNFELIGDKKVISSSENRNLFIALDEGLKKILNQLD